MANLSPTTSLKKISPPFSGYLSCLIHTACSCLCSVLTLKTKNKFGFPRCLLVFIFHFIFIPFFPRPPQTKIKNLIYENNLMTLLPPASLSLRLRQQMLISFRYVEIILGYFHIQCSQVSTAAALHLNRYIYTHRYIDIYIYMYIYRKRER